MKIRKISLISFIVLLAVVTVLMLIPSPPQVGKDFKYIDKIEHAGVFFVLSVLLLTASGFKTTENRRKSFLLLALLLVYGISIEFVQTFTGRMMEINDIFADLTGIAAGLVLYFFL